MSQKPTNAELELRIATIVEMLIKGQNRQDIIRYIAKTWGSSERTADNYIAKAWEKIEKITEKDIERLKNLAISRYEDLYKKNYNIQDYRECRQVQGDIVDLLGISEAKELNINVLPKLEVEILKPDESK